MIRIGVATTSVHVHGDEHEEPDEYQQVQGASGLDAQRSAHPLDASRQARAGPEGSLSNQRAGYRVTRLGSPSCSRIGERATRLSG
jgi:hypothetical protein